MKEEDKVLVNEFFNGNKELAFSRIFGKYYNKIRMRFLIACRDEFLAEDLANEVLIKVYEKLDSFNEELACLNTWITTIASNHFVDYLRKHGSNPEISIETLGKSTEDNEDGDSVSSIQFESDCLDPWQIMAHDERKMLLEEVISKSLKKEFLRELIHLRYFQEFSYEEIAKHLEIPVGTVKGSLFRARSIMEDYIIKNGSKDMFILS